VNRAMTESRVRIINREVVELDVLLSEFADQRQRRLDMFEPPVDVVHGKHHDDDVVLRQGKQRHRVEPGEVKVFRLEKKNIEVVHNADVVKFR
jgi:hypothetical protein